MPGRQHAASDRPVPEMQTAPNSTPCLDRLGLKCCDDRSLRVRAEMPLKHRGADSVSLPCWYFCPGLRSDHRRDSKLLLSRSFRHTRHNESEWRLTPEVA